MTLMDVPVYYAASGGEFNPLEIKLLKTIQVYTNASISCLAVDLTNHICYAGGSIYIDIHAKLTNIIKGFDIKTNKLVKELLLEDTLNIQKLSISCDRQILVSVNEWINSKDEIQLRFFDIDTEEELANPLTNNIEINNAVFSGNKRTLFISSRTLRTLKERIFLKSINIKHQDYSLYQIPGVILDVSDAEKKVLIDHETDDEPLEIWDFDKFKSTRYLEGHGGRNAYVASAKISPDGKTLITGGGEDGLIKIWDMDRGKLIQDIIATNMTTNCLDFSPNGKLIVGGCDDRFIRVWESASGKLAASIEYIESLDCVSFIDNQTFIGGGVHGWLSFWSIK
jgi:WD40 repeat protein